MKKIPPYMYEPYLFISKGYVLAVCFPSKNISYARGSSRELRPATREDIEIG